MGANQGKEDETPTSPKSPRVAPVDHASGCETLVPALLDKQDSRGDEDDTNSPLDGSVPGRVASQRSLPRRVSSGLFGGKKTDDTNESRVTARTLVLRGRGRVAFCLAALDAGRLASNNVGDGNVGDIHVWNFVDGTQIATLEGHLGTVLCLEPLGGSLLASGSTDKSVIIWSLADGKRKTLKGHRSFVKCLAALDGGRLASGSDDKSVIIWNLADGTPLANLEGPKNGGGEIICLAALDGCMLALPGKKFITIWSPEDNAPIARLKAHTDDVSCLAALDGGRLASGGLDKAVVIWNLADNKQFAKLEGHTDKVCCLAVLDGDRLASGSKDASIIIWNLADGEPLVRLEGHTDEVSCLAALGGDRLASGSHDETICIRPVLHAAAYNFATCGSAFEFEEVARACREQNCLGDLVDAATMNTFDQAFWKDAGLDEANWDASVAITTQAHVFDAIAKVINEEKETTRERLIESLAPRVLSLVNDKDMLPGMKRLGSNAVIQELASSPLFRVVLDAKFAVGPVFVLYFELFLFVLLGCCFTRVAAFEVLGDSKWFAAEKILEIVVAFVILGYFSAREIHQMWSTRAIELATPANPFKDAEGGLADWALLIYRLLVGFVVCLPLLPVFLVYFSLKRAGKQYKWMESFSGVTWTIPPLLHFNSQGWFGKTIVKPILHDPLTFLGLARAWRYDYWYLIDAATIGCAWAAFARAAMPGRRLSADLAVATAILMWIRFGWFLKNLRLGWAKFVLMIEKIIWDLRYFVFYFLVVLMMFASAFYLYIGPRKSADFGFHDDGAPNAYRNFGYTMYNLILLGFVGDFDADNFDEVVLRVLLVFYIIVVIVIFLNVLIAIVSDSYEMAMAQAEALYYRSRLELITETAPIASRAVPTWMLPHYGADERKYDDRRGKPITSKYAKLHKMIIEALDDVKKDKADDPNRINYTINAVEAIVENRTRGLENELAATRKELSETQQQLSNVMALLQRLVAKADA